VIKILDMGLARVEAVDKALEEGLTRAESFLGTPDYAAPEQAEDSRLADIRADLYSLGATWFFLLTGQVPFPGVSLMQKLRRQLTQPTPVVTDHRQDVPPAVVALVRRLMDRDPAQRFQTPAEFVEIITDCMRDPWRIPDWMSETPDEPLVVQAHSGSITALCTSGDGRLLFTGGDDESLRLWEAPGLDEIRAMSGNPGPVCGVAMIKSGKWGASCALRLMASDMTVQLWDLATGVEPKRLKGAQDNLVCVAIAPDGRKVAAGSRSGAVHLWTLDPPGTPPQILLGHAGTVTGVAFSPDGLSLFSGGLDGRLSQWDVETGQGEELMKGRAGSLQALSYAKADGSLALAGDALSLRRPDGSVLALSGHHGGALCVAFSADGTLLASGGRDGVVRLWRTSDDEELASFEGHAGPVRAVAFGPDRRFVYSGGADGTLRRWAVARSLATSGAQQLLHSH
jgi:hypothetical protein